MLFALLREISPCLDQCELTHLDRQPIDIDLAREHHQAYRDTLSKLSCQIIELPAEETLPDSVFVEDTAIVLEDVAIMTRPGAESRRGEIQSIEEVLAPYREIQRIVFPATLDGGDAIVHDRTIYIGRSSRSNEDGFIQLAALVAPYGYSVKVVTMTGCLHLKTGCSIVGPDQLLINRNWVDGEAFDDLELIDVHSEEPDAANALLVGETVIQAREFPRTREILQQQDINIVTVNNSELAKAEGGVTCCSIIFEADWKPRLVE